MSGKVQDIPICEMSLGVGQIKPDNLDPWGEIIGKCCENNLY